MFRSQTKLLCLALILQANIIFSQNKTIEEAPPKLVVGIVVDQMRNDFILRYWNRFGNGGFKRLVNEGYYFRNAHFNYIPTYTGPGHSSIYTGAVPRAHGIIANDWFVKTGSGKTNCVQDTLMKPVGTENKKARTSPKNMLSSTIGDEMKMNSAGKSKIFALACKDRSAILPAGHAANGAFWLDEGSGDFITSSWYMNELPEWLKKFNAKKSARTYLEKGWSTLYPIESYTNSIADDNSYEDSGTLKQKPVFPYDYKSMLEKNYLSGIVTTPYGNSITKDLAMECIKNESLGKDNSPDLLSISFSSPDILAHSYGPRAVEIEDVYLRLDKDLEELLVLLDNEVGKNNYSVFLTADHGASDVPNHLRDTKIPAGYIYRDNIRREIKNYFQKIYKDSLLLTNFSNEQVFLNHKKLSDLNLNKEEVQKNLCDFLIGIPGVAEAYPSGVIKNGTFDKTDLRTLLQNGYNHKLSGDVCVIYQPAWMDNGPKGTTHGSGYNYDTHVPVLFFGNGIKKGETFAYITITQIAPTVCELLKINQPNSTTSEPLNNYFSR